MRDERVLCVHNLANRVVSIQVPTGLWRNLLKEGLAVSGPEVALRPYETLWMEGART